jgi:enoyl-CoA hydratase
VTTIRYEAPGEDGVATATLDRPEHLNAITGEMFLEMAELCRRVDEDERVRALVLTGAGRGFCAGLDLDEAGDLADLEVTEFLRLQETGARSVAALREMKTPVVAAVNGPAAGGGLAFALAADVRLAAPSARFGVAFVRIGLTGCDVGVSWLLPRIVGLGHASELMLTGRLIDAEEAARIGLVNRVVPADDLLSDAYALAAEIAANGRFGTRLTKEVLQLNVDAPSLDAAIALENRNQALASRTGEVTERVRAFLSS